MRSPRHGPDLAPAVALQRQLLGIVIDLAATLDAGRCPAFRCHPNTSPPN
jgi:hypothetical protein